MRGPLIDLSSAEETARAIAAETMHFRLSILADIVMALADAALAVLLFLMFRSISAGLALTAFVFRSAWVPRILGLGIGLSGVVYLTGSLLRFAAPDLQALVAPAYLLPLIAETAFCLWLLFLPGQGRRAFVA